jgi:hypothetical protein
VAFQHHNHNPILILVKNEFSYYFQLPTFKNIFVPVSGHSDGSFCRSEVKHITIGTDKHH